MLKLKLYNEQIEKIQNLGFTIVERDPDWVVIKDPFGKTVVEFVKLQQNKVVMLTDQEAIWDKSPNIYPRDDRGSLFVSDHNMKGWEFKAY